MYEFTSERPTVSSSFKSMWCDLSTCCCWGCVWPLGRCLWRCSCPFRRKMSRSDTPTLLIQSSGCFRHTEMHFILCIEEKRFNNSWYCFFFNVQQFYCTIVRIMEKWSFEIFFLEKVPTTIKLKGGGGGL